MGQSLGFTRNGSKELFCDGVPLSKIAAAAGTPVYVYSAPTLRERYRALDNAFGDHPHAIHYALKANSTLAIARLIRELGGSADANTIWELELARKAGFAPADIVFTGVGKSRTELECAVPLGLKAINVESAGEIARVEAIAEQAGVVARVAVRVNPDIDAESHPHISTGLRANKFGVPITGRKEFVQVFGNGRASRLVAIHVHVGSQITTLEPLRRAAAFAARVSNELRDAGVSLEYVDLGGGLGISYDGQEVPSPEAYIATLMAEVRDTGLPIVIEPGRAITGPSAVLLSRIVDIKPRDSSSQFVVLDAGMSELLRPALYGAFHRIDPVDRRPGGERQYEIVGPVCESSDVIGRDRTLPPLEVGDVVAIHDAGAYGSAMASNYNRRPLPVEVLVDDGTWRVIRRRQTLDDMLSLET